MSDESTGPILEASPEQNLNALFSQYAILREDKNRIDMQLDAIDKAITPVKDQIIALMVELEYQSINHDGIKYWLAVTPHVSVNAETRDGLLVKLEEEGEYGIVQTTYIHPSSVKGWYNNLPEDKQEKFHPYLNLHETITLNSPKDYKRSRKKK